MGQCQYTYNPSEQYQRTKPGMAPETICGARTHPAVDEPELVPMPRGDGTTEFRESGRVVARGYADPYCPVHGGSPEPPQPPVTMPEIENAYANYMTLAQRFQGAVPTELPTPEQIAQLMAQQLAAPVKSLDAGEVSGNEQ